MEDTSLPTHTAVDADADADSVPLLPDLEEGKERTTTKGRRRRRKDTSTQKRGDERVPGRPPSRCCGLCCEGVPMSRNLSVLYVALCACTLLAVGEVVLGAVANSLVILADSVHMFLDSATYVANIYAENRRLRRNGQRKDEPFVLGLHTATFSLVVMIGASAFILDEAIRLLNDEDGEKVPDATMIVVLGIVGLFLDGLTLCAFACITEDKSGGDEDDDAAVTSLRKSDAGVKDDTKNSAATRERGGGSVQKMKRVRCGSTAEGCENMIETFAMPNMCSAVVHTLGDLFRSVTMIVGGVWIDISRHADPVRVDAVCAIVVSCLVFVSVLIALGQVAVGYKRAYWPEKRE